MGLKLKLIQGSTYRKHLRWEVEPFVYRPIVAIDSSAPCVVHCPDHGLLIDQTFVIQASQGLTELNAAEPHCLENWYRGTYIDKDTVQINRVNSTLFKKHTPNTGNIKYRSVVDLDGYTARMMIRERVGGAILYTLTTELGNLILDTVNQFVEIIIPDDVTADFDWKKGTYDLEMVSPLGVVTKIVSGDVTVTKENTTL